MRGFVVVLLIAMASLIYAEQVQAGPDCIPQSASENPLVMEKVCSSFLDADCGCSISSDGVMKCRADFNQKLRLHCDEYACNATFLDQSDLTKPELIDPEVAESLCELAADADCACEKAGSSDVYCSITNANITLLCDDDGCDASTGAYSKHFGFCIADGIIGIRRVQGNMRISIEGQVEGAENGKELLRNGVISISGQLGNGVEVQIVADLESVRRNSNVRAAKSEIKSEVRSKFAEAIKMRYNTDNFKTIDAIEIHLEELSDGEEITSAKIRFKVPKQLVDGRVVILRHADNGEVSVLIPEVVDAGDYYIYEVKTGGLSLYAVATVQQISEPLSESQETPASPLCGAAGAILLLTGSLYAVRARI